ncbi:MAG: D-lyxose/D-mannose family sugar isomerase [Verrucomicrobiales bacterium]|jgi:D-lyxose ketol-isomerase|nr:D-lyxose/D-mannose family sugar isomerase [Verrucomicrobiales bacterium]
MNKPNSCLTRSQINRLIDDSLTILRQAGFHLPPFATWTSTQWENAGPEWNSARRARLGWDVTDFGLGRFQHVGRVLFTLRNGSAKSGDKPYAEKIIVGRHGQRAPAHYHQSKTEDIINRGGGEVVLKLDPPVETRYQSAVFRDGCALPVTPGTLIRLQPGESLCLPAGIIHQFWGEETLPGKTPLIGEVSSFCDDVNDNVFFDEVARFVTISEDEPARYCLCNELPDYAPTEPALVPAALELQS